jgi:hypothetical protein
MVGPRPRGLTAVRGAGPGAGATRGPLSPAPAGGEAAPEAAVARGRGSARLTLLTTVPRGRRRCVTGYALGTLFDGAATNKLVRRVSCGAAARGAAAPAASSACSGAPRTDGAAGCRTRRRGKQPKGPRAASSAPPACAGRVPASGGGCPPRRSCAGELRPLCCPALPCPALGGSCAHAAQSGRPDDGAAAAAHAAQSGRPDDGAPRPPMRAPPLRPAPAPPPERLWAGRQRDPRSRWAAGTPWSQTQRCSAPRAASRRRPLGVGAAPAHRGATHGPPAPKARLSGPKICARRDSNPGLVRGRDLSYP